MNPNTATSPTEWYNNRKKEYQNVLNRLARVRRVTLNGDISKAAENLRLSYLNAVMSIQTDKDRHERAFTAYTAGEKDLEGAMSLTVYGNQKYDWASRTLSSTDWESVAMAVRHHVREGDLLSLLNMEDTLVGVSHTKWSFTLAMVGVWELACIDSNVTRHLELDGRERHHDANTPVEYMELLNRVHTAVDAPIPPFLAQWVIYDFEREEHARHMSFFREVHQ